MAYHWLKSEHMLNIGIHFLPPTSGFPDEAVVRRDYSRDLRPVKWDSDVRLHGSNIEPLMSASGRERPIGSVRATSAMGRTRTRSSASPAAPL